MNGRDIFKYTGGGITVEHGAEWQWREAARFAGVRWREFCQMDGDEMADVVAHWMAHRQLGVAIDEAGRG